MSIVLVIDKIITKKCFGIFVFLIDSLVLFTPYFLLPPRGFRAQLRFVREFATVRRRQGKKNAQGRFKPASSTPGARYVGYVKKWLSRTSETGRSPTAYIYVYIYIYNILYALLTHIH